MKHLTTSLFLFTSILLLSGCQKVDINDFNEPAPEQEGSTNITFNIRQFEQVPFNNAKSSRARDIKEFCSNVCLAIYFGNERVKDDKQKSSDSDFGTFSLTLDEGTYRAMIVAHNQKNNPQTTNPDKVQFNNDLTDAFYWSKEINVIDGESQNIDVDMHRLVAMVRFVTTDSVPENVESMKFYYTGGSGAFDASTGLGSVNSKQTAIRQITRDMKGKPATFEIYTIPKEEDGSELKIQVTGLDANGKSVFERTFESVPIKRNMITINKGRLFVNAQPAAGAGSAKFTLTTSDEWETTETEY